jgi:hypothetical protein
MEGDGEKGKVGFPDRDYDLHSHNSTPGETTDGVPENATIGMKFGREHSQGSDLSRWGRVLARGTSEGRIAPMDMICEPQRLVHIQRRVTFSTASSVSHGIVRHLRIGAQPMPPVHHSDWGTMDWGAPGAST